MYQLFHLKTNHEKVGIAVAKGGRVARFFKDDHVNHDYYEEIGSVKYPWMVWSMFIGDYPDLLEMDRYIKDGMALKIFLMHDGTQEE